MSRHMPIAMWTAADAVSAMPSSGKGKATFLTSVPCCRSSVGARPSRSDKKRKGTRPEYRNSANWKGSSPLPLHRRERRIRTRTCRRRASRLATRRPTRSPDRSPDIDRAVRDVPGDQASPAGDEAASSGSRRRDGVTGHGSTVRREPSIRERRSAGIAPSRAYDLASTCPVDARRRSLRFAALKSNESGIAPRGNPSAPLRRLQTRLQGPVIVAVLRPPPAIRSAP